MPTFPSKRPGKWDYSNHPKKLIVKNYEKLQKSEEYYTKCWDKLKNAILSILNPNSANLDSLSCLEDLYSAVLDLCSAQKSANAYLQLKEILANYVRKTLLTQFTEYLQYNDQQFLSKLENCWNCYCVQLKMIRNIFLFLDRTYVLRNPQIFSVWDLGLDLFRVNLVCDVDFHQKLFRSLLDLIARDRQNESERTNRVLIRNIFRLLHDLNVYEEFEIEYLKESKQYFSTEGARNIRSAGAITSKVIMSYLDFIDHKLNEEAARIDAFQVEAYATSKKLVNIIEKELIGAHLDVILTTHIFETLFNDPIYLKYNKLSYDLLSRVLSGTARLCTCFNQFIKTKGKSMVQLACTDPEKEKTLIQELIDFKDRMDCLVRECFGGNERFALSMKEAFENFINVRTNKVAELIAKYVDEKLRQAEEDIPFDQLFDKVMVLFRFIHGKDIFEAFYQRDLSKRLLGGKSASTDAEKLMLLKLKQECGGAFTSKLESMFKDIELSRELTTCFKKYLISQKADHGKGSLIDMNVSVLTTGIWPSTQSVELLVSKELQQYEEVFTKFYLAKHQGRKLQWQHSYGHCVLKANFNQVTKELQVSFIQALVLLQFNQKDELSLNEIRTELLLNSTPSGAAKLSDENEFRRTLQSLACGKVRVLTKKPKGRDILDGDSFVFNNDFQHKLFRVKINQVQWKETSEENVATQERVGQDRQYQLDAAVVRIMKARKVLTHSALVAEIYEKINFPIATPDLKKRIESLIERDYLKREKDDPNVYNYVA